MNTVSPHINHSRGRGNRVHDDGCDDDGVAVGINSRGLEMIPGPMEVDEMRMKMYNVVIKTRY